MFYYLCTVFFADFLLTRVLGVCDGWEVKQLLHSRFIFEDINDGKIAIITSLDFSNESVKMILSRSAIST